MNTPENIMKKMKIKVEFTVEIDPEEFIDTFGWEKDSVRAEFKEFAKQLVVDGSQCTIRDISFTPDYLKNG